MAVIGLDLGATKLAGALFGRDGTVLERAGGLLEDRGGDEVGRLIVERVSALQSAAAARRIEVEAVGVSVPGIVHHEEGTVWAPNIAGWERYPLRDVLRAEVGSSCQVVVESDRAASILGEVSRGVARGCRHAIFLAVGTGIGAGILVDGSIVRGGHDIAGAIGWMGLDRPYQAAYRRCGGFESHASGAGIARVTRELLEAEPGYQGTLRALAPRQVTAHEVFNAFAAELHGRRGRFGADQGPPGQDRACLHDGVCDPGLDDHHHGGGGARGAWGQALDTPVAQCAGRHDGARAAGGRPARVQATHRGRVRRDGLAGRGW
jgi:glucokinase